MNREEMADRRLEAMSAAASRWEQKVSEAIETTDALQTGGRLAATSKAGIDEFLIHQAQKPSVTDRAFLAEAVIGDTVDFEDVAPDQAAEDAGHPVARIVELQARGRIGEGFATGFLIAPNLLVTNWHVFASVTDTRNCGAQFNYEKTGAGAITQGVVFPVDAGSFFFSDETLDIAIVALNSDVITGQGALKNQGAVKIIPAPGKYLVGNPVNIIQHPDGRPKQWASSQNGIRVEPASEDLFLHYLTDTLPGSSGSPTFNHDWELIAVHHAGVPRRVNGRIVRWDGKPWSRSMPEEDIDWEANEGARVSKVYELLKSAHLPNAGHQVQLAKLLADIGSLGNTAIGAPVTEGKPSPLIAASTDGTADRRSSVNVVVNGTANFYLGSEASAAASSASPPPSPGRAIAPPADIQAVVVEKKLTFDRDYPNRPGHDPKFLDGFRVEHPRAPLDEVLKRGNGQLILRYHHYSLVMHRDRHLAMWTASNANYNESLRRKTREEFGEDFWKADPRIKGEDQIEDLEFYAPAVKFDRGHLVRRDDVAWGPSAKEEEYGNSDSFHWTNCTPQHEGFNRDMFQYDGLWGQLENHITSQAKFVGRKCIIFAGPVLDENDPFHDFGDDIVMQVPKDFWKVIVVVESTNGTEQLRAYGFVLDQTDAINEYGWERRFQVGKFKEQQRSLDDITRLTRVTFGDALYGADPLADVVEESRRTRSLQTLDDLVLA